MAVSKEIDVFVLPFDVQYDVEKSTKENESEGYRSRVNFIKENYR